MRLSEFEEEKKTYDKQKIEEEYDEFKGMSKDQLYARLVQEIKAQKSAGTFDYDGLYQTIQMMKAYLPEQTYKNILTTLEEFR